MDDSNSSNKNLILEPLNLSATPSNEEKCEIMVCLFCEESQSSENEKQLLQHLYLEHRFVISDANDIADLTEYLKFWKEEFKG